MTAIVSRGGELPSADGEGFQAVKAGNVLFISAEDDLDDTIAPKLIAAGADMNRVFSYKESDTDHLHFTSPSFERLISECRPSLVIVDPNQGFFGRADMHRSNHVRPIMTHIKRLCERYNSAIILVEHMGKPRGGGKAFHRGLGSIDITSAARSVLLVSHDPDNEEERGICQIKGNLGPLGNIVGFYLTGDGIEWNPIHTLLPICLTGGKASRGIPTTAHCRKLRTTCGMR